MPPARKSMNRVSFYNLTNHRKGVDGAGGGGAVAKIMGIKNSFKEF